MEDGKMIKNALSERLMIKSSITITMFDSRENLFKTSREYKTRDNIESMIMLCNWLIETHEAVGQERHFSHMEDDVRDSEIIRSLQSKMNVIIRVISQNTIKKENLVNVKLNSIGVMIEDDKPRDGKIAIEMYMHDSVAKRVIIMAEQKETEDGLVWMFEGMSSMEIDLFDKMVFLIDRNLTASKH
jgi:hypothetical protein